MIIIHLYKFQLCLIWILHLSVYNSKQNESDIFASTAEMEPLIKIEREFPKLLEKYIQAEKERLKEIKEFSKNFIQLKYKNQLTDAESFIGNPINVFHLIKRFTFDMLPLLKLMNFTNMQVFTNILTANGINVKFPNDNDFKGVALGIDRLKQTYNLSINSLVNGEVIPGIKSGILFTANDCFQIGRAVYMNRFYEKAIPWFNSALSIEAKEMDKTISKLEIIEYLSFCEYKVGNITRATELTQEYLKFVPAHEKMKKNLAYYLYNKEKLDKPPKKESSPTEWDGVMLTYEKLCRNEQLLDAKKLSHLKCHFAAKSPFLILQPTKLEIIHHNPWVAIIHDVIRDREINQLKNLAIPKLKRAQVGGLLEKGQKSTADYRISKVGWLIDEEHEYVDKLTKRLEAISGLTAKNASDFLQMNNYGIGGHYEPHMDHAEEIENTTQARVDGNRIATILIYFNDVMAGGATVFPRLKIGVFPQKGTAVFWYNIFQTGKGDNSTLHAACPVLAGTKWVANKWIYQYAQMFKKPCGLSENHLYQEY